MDNYSGLRFPRPPPPPKKMRTIKFGESNLDPLEVKKAVRKVMEKEKYRVRHITEWDKFEYYIEKTIQEEMKDGYFLWDIKYSNAGEAEYTALLIFENFNHKKNISHSYGSNIYTVKTLSEKHKNFITPGKLRWLIYKNPPNFAECIFRVSNKIYIKEDKLLAFMETYESINNKGNLDERN